MKKIFALTLASLLCIGTSAQSRHQAATLNLPKSDSGIQMQKSSALSKDFKLPAFAAATAPTSINDYAGNYVWTCSPLLQGQSEGPEEISIEVTDAEKGEVKIVGIFAYADIPATIDIATGTLSIKNKTYLMNDSDGPIYFYLKEINSSGSDFIPGATSAEAAQAIYSNGVFTFDTYEIWAIGDPDSENLGYYSLSYANVIASVQDVNPNDGWTSIGEATFQDGWVLPTYNVNQTLPENHYKVELQQSDVDKNIYRLVNPYRGNFPYAQYNESTVKNGYIVFNVTDPDHVYFDAVDAGYADTQLELSRLYCMNSLTYYMGKYGKSKDEVVSTIGNEQEWTTFKDGVVLLPYYNDATYGYINDACFGIQNNIYAGYAWNAQDGSALNMETKIIFPDTAVDALEVTNDAPEAFYNLQGIRIAEPQPGQLYIRTKGGVATKVLK